MGRGYMGQIRGALPAVGWGAVGFVGTSALPGFASRFVPVPDKATNPLMHYGVRTLAALATGWIVGMFVGRRQGAYALAGGGINIAADVVLTYAGPALGLSEYIGPDMAAYLDEPGAVGYLSPGRPVEQLGYDEDVTERLDPDRRF